MHQPALFKAIRYFGTQQKLADAIGVSQQAISQWLCHDSKIPYAQAVKIMDATRGYVGLQELAPLEKAANRAIQRLITTSSSQAIEIPVSLIDVNEQHCPLFKQQENLLAVMTEEEVARPLIVDSNNQLVSCECRLWVSRLQGWKSIKVWIVDLAAILQGEQAIDTLLPLLPISERVALGLRLEKQMGSRQGQRTDLPQLPQNFAEVAGKANRETRQILAKLVGFGNHETYRMAKQVVSHGSSKLVRVMDQQLTSVFKAAQINRLPETEQQAYFEQISKK